VSNRQPRSTSHTDVNNVNTVPGEKYPRPHRYFFSFFVLGQPASANDIQGIRLHKPPKMKL